MTHHCNRCGRKASGHFQVPNGPGETLCPVCARTLRATFDYPLEDDKPARKVATNAYALIAREALQLHWWHYDGSRLRYCHKRQSDTDTHDQFWRSDGDDEITRIVSRAYGEFEDKKPSDLCREVRRLICGAPETKNTSWPPKEPPTWSMCFADRILILDDQVNKYVPYTAVQARPYSPLDYVEAGHTMQVDMPDMAMIDELHGLTLAQYIFESLWDDVRICGLMYQVVALCMLNSYPVEKFIVGYGDGNNGKTSLASLVMRLLGDNNVATASLQDFAGRFGAAQLAGKLANIGDEFPPDPLVNVERLKQLSGNSRLNAEAKFQDAYPFRNRATLLFFCNQIPMVESETDGFWRRVIPVHFPRLFRKDNPATRSDLKEKIARIGIDTYGNLNTQDTDLLWLAAVGIREAHRLMLGGDLYYDPGTSEVAEVWRKAANPVVQYIEEHCEIDAGAVIAKASLLSQLNQYQAHRYHGARPRITPRQLDKYMDAEGYGKMRAIGTDAHASAHQTCYSGLRFAMPSPLCAFSE